MWCGLFLLATWLTQACCVLRGNHTNNWAILVDTSKFWFNYRHVANTLSIYRSIKRLGIPDSQIILMLADDAPCNPRNPRPGTVYHNSNQRINIYGDDVEVDYRGYEVTAENFIRILTGRVTTGTPQSKQMMIDENSNVLVYMTGHGGVGFLKFQDTHEISDKELADMFQQMYHKRRYNNLLFIIETCKAGSMLRYLYSPNVIGLAASRHDEDSYSHHSDSSIGVHVIDRFSHYLLEFVEKMDVYSEKTLADLFTCCSYHQCHSHTVSRTDLFARDSKDTLVTEFFGSVRKATVVTEPQSAFESTSEEATDIDESAARKGRSPFEAASSAIPPMNMMTVEGDNSVYGAVIAFGTLIALAVGLLTHKIDNEESL
jgi:phosphatidylinositol glycan class K